MIETENDTLALPHRTLMRVILPIFAFSSFFLVFNNLIIGAVLVEIAQEFRIPVGAAGLLITVYALAAGVIGLFVGPLIDHYGRRRTLLFSMTILTISALVAALAPNLPALVAARGVAGLGVGTLQPAVLAGVGDYFPYRERGRAMAYVVTANTAASVLGVPVGALLAGLTSWRITLGILAAISLLAALTVWLRLPDLRRKAGAPMKLGTVRGSVGLVLRDRMVSATLTATFISSIAWFLWLAYQAAFFIKVFNVSQAQVAPFLSLLGLGVLIGSNIGGRLGDRHAKKPIIIVSTLAGAVLITAETTIASWLWLAMALNFLLAVPGGTRYVPFTTLLTEMVPEARGTVMAFNSAANQFGLTLGAALGGLVVEMIGYWALGPVSGALTFLSALIVYFFIHEDRIGRPMPVPTLAAKD